MARTRVVYICQRCGARHARWGGQCASCGEWNCLEESAQDHRPGRTPVARPLTVHRVDSISDVERQRLASGCAEWDRVLGGGLVPGSVVLLGGEPGVGKSTLLMQVADGVGRSLQSAARSDPCTVLYVSGEESLPQIALRSRRLGLDPESMRLSSETELAPIVDFVTSQPPGLLVVDSIQSVHDVGLESVPGSVGQVRECALQLTRVAKEHRVATLLIGHVTKEGAIAGPKVVEHIVDAVLYLEGERFQSYRLLRGVKNRFGATNEVGVFEMRDGGFAEVPDPSAAFLSDRVDGSPGSTVVVAMEGTRPLLVEVQALVTRTSFSMPRRVASGIDFNRIVLLIAILAKRGGVALHESDIHVNVVGGLHIEETAVDLGVALAVLSSHRDVALCAETVVIGELGLAGEVRGVGQTAARLREAAKLGFRRAIVPASSAHAESEVSGIEIIPVRTLREAARLAGVQ